MGELSDAQDHELFSPGRNQLNSTQEAVTEESVVGLWLDQQVNHLFPCSIISSIEFYLMATLSLSDNDVPFPYDCIYVPFVGVRCGVLR